MSRTLRQSTSFHDVHEGERRPKTSTLTASWALAVLGLGGDL